MLLAIRGIGPEFAAILWSEGLFRHFENRRQIAAYAGLAPTPWQSGTIDREQGVSKAGNPRLLTALIQLAWLWTRHEPSSALTQWFLLRVSRMDLEAGLLSQWLYAGMREAGLAVELLE